MSVYTYSGTPAEKETQAQNNVLNAGLADIPTMSDGSVRAMRDAVLAEAAAAIGGAGDFTTLHATGAVTFDSTFRASGATGIGATPQARVALYVASGSVTASTALAAGIYQNSTLIAAANNDVLTGIRTESVRTPGAFTGVLALGFDIQPFSVATFTTPADPIGLRVGIVTGTGATNAYGIKFGDGPTGATNNYVLHSTNAHIKSTGQINTASSVLSTSPTAGVGYATGAGGAQTQLTSKATTVVSNTVTTEITTHNAALNAGVIVSFTFTNSAITALDHVVVTHVSGGTMGCYNAWCTPGAGTSTIYIKNISAGNLSEAIVLKITMIKGVVS